jgi:uncharacterized ion transporter superfamily protein YfcC
MRFLSLIFALAIVAWLLYTYLDSGQTIKMDSDKSVQQQTQETMQRAQDSAEELQRSLDKNQQQLDKLE